MDLSFKQLGSLKVRILVTVLTMFVVSIGLLSFGASRLLRADMEKTLGDQQVATVAPDGHFKFPHLWPVKFPQAGRANYQSFDVSRAIRAAASFSR